MSNAYDSTDFLEAVEELVHLIPLFAALELETPLVREPSEGKRASIYNGILWDRAARVGELLAAHPDSHGEYDWAAAAPEETGSEHGTDTEDDAVGGDDG